MSNRFALGLDFGGTKLAAGVVDLQEMRLVDAAFCATRAEAAAEGAVADMIALASNLGEINRISQIGICFGGYAAHNQIIKSLHIPGWDHFPIHERLQAHFGSLPIFVANDANAVALGEFRYGAGQGSHSMLFLTVSTGVGGGVILGGHLWEGSTGIAGEIGHMNAIPDGGAHCYCGRYGCVETVAAGPWMVKRAHALLNQEPDLTSALRQHPEFTARDMNQYAEAGDSLAARVMREGARYLGIAIGNTVNLLDINSVVIGGGVSRSGALWWDTLRAAVQETVLPWRSPVALKPSGLGTHEGIWGAVALLPENPAHTS